MRPRPLLYIPRQDRDVTKIGLETTSLAVWHIETSSGGYSGEGKEDWPDILRLIPFGPHWSFID